MYVVRLLESLFALKFKNETKQSHRLEPVLTSKMQKMNQDFRNLLKHLQQPSSKLEIRSLAGPLHTISQCFHFHIQQLPRHRLLHHLAGTTRASPSCSLAFCQAVHTKRTILSANRDLFSRRLAAQSSSNGCEEYTIVSILEM